MIEFLDKWLPLKGSDDQILKLSLFGRLFFSLAVFIAYPATCIIAGINHDSFWYGFELFLIPIGGLLIVMVVVGLAWLINR